MAKDTVTIALSGEVDLHRFATAVYNLELLVQGLSKAEGTDKIRWVIADLQVSSAMATARGESDVLAEVERVVNAYEDIGESYQSGRRPAGYSDAVVRAADAIVNVVGDKVTSIRFETPDKEFTVASRPELAISAVIKSFGAIEGRIQTLSNRKGLRFVLFDTLNDRAVSCYITEGQEERMREIWGKRAIVEGEISREKETGRPIAIRHITDVKVLLEPERGSYLQARGIAPRKPSAPLAEEIIRRLRDV